MIWEHAFWANNSVTELAEVFNLFVLMLIAKYFPGVCLSHRYLRNWVFRLTLSLWIDTFKSRFGWSLIDAVYILQHTSKVILVLVLLVHWHGTHLILKMIQLFMFNSAQLSEDVHDFPIGRQLIIWCLILFSSASLTNNISWSSNWLLLMYALSANSMSTLWEELSNLFLMIKLLCTLVALDEGFHDIFKFLLIVIKVLFYTKSYLKFWKN